MIGWLAGTVRLRDPATGTVVLDTGAAGYQVIVSLQTLASIPEVGDRCELWIHTHVREEALALYGFATLEERQLFQMLISVPKVGPRNAVAVLSGFPLPELVTALAEGDAATLTRIPGVGKQIAAQIIVALEAKVQKILPALTAGTPTPVADAPSGQLTDLREEAKTLLTNLGWRGKQVDTALDKTFAEVDDFESLDELVRRVLARLMER